MKFHTSAVKAFVAASTGATIHGLTTCSPMWKSGCDYFAGSRVSQIITTSKTDSSGTATTVSTVKNFVCTHGTQPMLSHCSAYNPSNSNQQSAAWKDEGECEPSLAPSPITCGQLDTSIHPEWAGEGCPKPWVAGMSYGSGDLVQREGIVYKCLDAGFSSFCGQSGFVPGDGDSLFWKQAWVLLGSCSGTISPSASPNFLSLDDAGGCPDEYQKGMEYGSGDKVSMSSIVYACKDWPYSQWCSMDGYEPDGPNAAQGWTVMGHCDGTNILREKLNQFFVLSFMY